MFKRIIISLLMAFMFIVPLIPGSTSGDFDEDILDLTPHWKEFSRDGNENGIDDLIDESSKDEFNIYIVYDHQPTDPDVKILESLGLDIFYRAKYVDCILVKSVARDQINLIRFIKGVSMVELAVEFKPFLDVSTKAIKARPTSLAADGVKYPDVWEELGYNGSGVNIAILDTGVDNNFHDSLNDLDDNLFTYDPKFIAGWWGVGGRYVDPDDYGFTSHGTHCAGIALGTGAPDNYIGVAPGARLVDVKVMSDVGAGGIPLPAIEWCIANNDTDWENDGPANDGIDVMSMSIGGADSNGDDQISLAVNQAAEAGIVVVAAIGNGQGHNVNTPAAANGAIAVAASDDHGNVNRTDDTFATFSNYGPRGDGNLKPDITAPGTNIMSAIKHTGGLIWGSMSGTSQATPHVAGVAALMLQANPDLTPEDVKDILRISATERGNNHISPEEPKYDTHWGWGLVDAYAAVNLALGLPDLTVISMEVMPSGSSEGDDIRILADIKELNDRDAEADIEFYDETDEKLLSTVHGTFTAGETNTVTSEIFSAAGGDRTFKVTITNVEPMEMDDTNNQMIHSTHINYRPVPDVTSNRSRVLTKESVKFDGSESTDRDGEVKQYKFDFGDGESTSWQTDPTAEHSYEDDGEYTISLRVKDDKSAESIDPAEVVVTVDNRKPTAGAGSDRTATEGDEVEFSGTGEDEDGTIELYEWDFDGDGEYDWSSGDNGDTTHTYEEEGNYTAILRVTDDDNATATDDRLIEVLPKGTPNNPPVAIIDSPGDGDKYQLEDEINFDGDQSFDPDGDKLSYSWTDNGHEFSSEKKFSTTLEGGSHRIVLQVDDGRGGVDSEEVNIYVNSPPVARMKTPEDGNIYYTNEDIDFDASTSSDPDDDDLGYSWKINGEEASTKEKFYQKLDEGDYEIKLHVDDGEGASDDADQITIHVEKPKNKPPVAVISKPVEGQEFRDNETIPFDGRESSDPDDDPITFEWYIDDDPISSDPMFTYDPNDHEVKTLENGDHEVHLIVWDDKEENSHDYVTITITDNKRPTARITEPEDGAIYTEGVAIDFDGTHSTDEEGDDLSFEWRDGNDVISQEAVFSKPLNTGEHRIYLTVNDSRKQDTTSVLIRVNKRPTAVISSPSDKDMYFSDEVVIFDATSSSDPDGKIISYVWYDNGERLGSGSTMETALDTGEHEITLTVRDDDGSSHSSLVTVRSVDHSIGFRVQEDEKEADPGENAIFHLNIHNLAEKSDHIRLSAEEQVDFSEESFILGPNAERTITMTVSSSRDIVIHLKAEAGQFPFYTTTKLKMSQVYDVKIATSKNALSGVPGATLNYILVVTNKGNGDDTISMRFESSKSWEVTLDKESLALHPGTSEQVIVKVRVPETAAKGDNMVLDVTATSRNGETAAKITLTTTADESPVNPDQNQPEKKDNSIPGFDIILALLGVASSASLMHMKRRR